MSDGFSKLAADLEKLFGLGPLFVDTPEEPGISPVPRGARQAQEAFVALSANEAASSGTRSSAARSPAIGGNMATPKLAKTGVAATGKVSSAVSAHSNASQSAGTSSGMTGRKMSLNAVLTPPGGATGASSAFGSALAIYSAWEAGGKTGGSGIGASVPGASLLSLWDELERRSVKGGGGGGGGKQQDLTLSRAKSAQPALHRQPSVAAKAAAARAAVAAGAQAAVFKVVSTPSSQGSAKALMEYLGRREGEDGKKHDIEIQAEDGRLLGNRAERDAYLVEFTEQFRDPFTNTNFIEVEMSVPVETNRDALHEALNQAFGSKPFIYSRQGETVKIFAYTDAKAGKLNKDLAAVKEGGERAGGLHRLEEGLKQAMNDAGVSAAVTVTAAVGTERATQYFLQKFMRSNSSLVDHAGSDVKVAKRADRSAAKVYEGWKPLLQTREVRNAFHLLFSAKAGTDPQAVIAAAKATLDAQASGHKFVIAHHPETSHVHVHAMVSAVSAGGDRLAFRKADLHAWRETYAEKMRENGVEMVATRRMDMGAGRPFTMRHAGAVERAKSDPRYQVGRKTTDRVENKRSGLLEPATFVANGGAIANGWHQSAALLHGSGASNATVETAARFAATVLSFEGRSTLTPSATGHAGIRSDDTTKSRAPNIPDSEPFMRRPEMQEIMKMIGDTAMAKTPLEMRERMHDINSSLDKMRQTLPQQEQVKFDEFREKISDQMHDRLATTRHEQQKPAGAQQSEERQMRERDVRTKLEPQQTAGKQVEGSQQSQTKTAAANKAKTKDAEQQNRRTQRSQDNEYER